LQGDIEDLRQGNDAVQELARLQLGMVKTDEVFVQVMSQAPTPNAPAGTNAAPAR
jgi:cell division protein FtsB